MCSRCLRRSRRLRASPLPRVCPHSLWPLPCVHPILCVRHARHVRATSSITVSVDSAVSCGLFGSPGFCGCRFCCSAVPAQLLPYGWSDIEAELLFVQTLLDNLGVVSVEAARYLGAFGYTHLACSLCDQADCLLIMGSEAPTLRTESRATSRSASVTEEPSQLHGVVASGF